MVLQIAMTREILRSNNLHSSGMPNHFGKCLGVERNVNRYNRPFCVSRTQPKYNGVLIITVLQGRIGKKVGLQS